MRMRAPSARLVYGVTCALFGVSMVSLAACGDSDDRGEVNNPLPDNPPSNRIRLTFDCVLTQGVIGELRMDVEAIGNTGITWGPGPTPDITGVIGTGDYTLYTWGELVSPTSRYTFTGENRFADFNDLSNTSYFDFRVEWREIPGGLLMVVNPFGDPTYHECELTSAGYL